LKRLFYQDTLRTNIRQTAFLDFLAIIVCDHRAAVLTCFFIDTAPNIIEYIDCIWDLLEPGGMYAILKIIMIIYNK